MVYLDSSVALAELLVEDRRPPRSIWDRRLVSSRLLQYELWTCVNARQLARSHGEAASRLLDRVSFLELSAPVLERALEAFPVPVRTLDALHLASCLFLAARGLAPAIATYDRRMAEAAARLGIPLYAV